MKVGDKVYWEAGHTLKRHKGVVIMVIPPGTLPSKDELSKTGMVMFSGQKPRSHESYVVRGEDAAIWQKVQPVYYWPHVNRLLLVVRNF